MKSKIGISALICLFVLSGVSYAAEKSAFVEIGKVFNEYEKTKELDGVLKAEGEAKSAERTKKIEQIQRLKDEMTLLADGGEEKRNKQASVDMKMRELKLFDEQARLSLQEKRDANLKEIFDDIETTIADYGKQKKYDFIFNDGALVYQNETLNVTDVVLKELNKGYQK